MLKVDNFSISPIQQTDAWSICNFVVSNEDRLKDFFPKTLEQNLTPTLSKVFVEKKAKQFQLKQEYLFTIKNNKEIIGLVYIKELHKKMHQGELAYCVAYQFECKGLMTKAVNLLSQYAFRELNIDTLQIIAHKENIASVKVAINNGFTWKQTLKNEYTPPYKTPLDMELYELYKN